MLNKMLDRLHQIVFDYHDRIVYMLKECDQISFQSVALHGIEGASDLPTGEDLYYWMMKSGYEDKAREMDLRNVIMAVTSGMCHLVYESLKRAQKNKITVAYALSRKPFTENLFQLEWILADEDDFYTSFQDENPHVRGSSIVGGENDKIKRIETIAKAMACTELGGVLDASYMYDIRYNKECDHGLQKLWHKATHLVTSFRTIKTEPGNYNFIYSDSLQIQRQIEHFYTLIIPFLFHASEVIEKLISNFEYLGQDLASYDRLRRIALFAENRSL